MYVHVSPRFLVISRGNSFHGLNKLTIRISALLIHDHLVEVAGLTKDAWAFRTHMIQSIGLDSRGNLLYGALAIN